MTESKIQTLDRAATRLEQLMELYLDFSQAHRDQLNKAHREIKEVRDQLSHEALIEKRTGK